MVPKRGLKDILALFLKALFVMIFPLTLIGINLLQLLVFPTTGLLFLNFQYNPEFLISSTALLTAINGVVRNFVIGLLIALPGIFFNYKIEQAPLNKSYWKRGVGTAISVYFVSIAIIFYLSLNLLDPYGYIDETYWLVYQKLIYYPTLIFGVFIIYPLIKKQVIIIASPQLLHDMSMNEIERNPNLSVCREKFLGAVLWVLLCFGPYTLGYSPFYYWGGIPLSSLMMNYYINSNPLLFIDTLNISFSASVNQFLYFPFLVLILVLHFVFVRDIYRYLQKSIKKQRVIAMAIISSIAPYFISMILFRFLFVFIGFNPIATIPLIPLPLLQLTGFLVIRYHRPFTDQDERIWKKDKSRRWWEMERPEAIITSPEKPDQHRENEVITIPLHYLLLSKIRQRNQQSSE